VKFPRLPLGNLPFLKIIRLFIKDELFCSFVSPSTNSRIPSALGTGVICPCAPFERKVYFRSSSRDNRGGYAFGSRI